MRPPPSTPPGSEPTAAPRIIQSPLSASYHGPTPPFAILTAATSASSSIIQNNGSDTTDRSTRWRAAERLSCPNREGSRKSQHADSAASQTVADSEKNCGATAKRARCAASPYLAISFCTSVRQAETKRSAEAIVVVVGGRLVLPVVERPSVLGTAEERQVAVQGVVQPQTEGERVEVVVLGVEH